MSLRSSLPVQDKSGLGMWRHKGTGRVGKPGAGHMVLTESLLQTSGLTQSGFCFQEDMEYGSHPHLTLLDTSGHGQLILLLQQTRLPFHGEDVELRARAWRGESGAHQTAYKRDPLPPPPAPL